MREEGGRGKGHHFTVGSLSLCLVLVSWWLCVCVCECVSVCLGVLVVVCAGTHMCVLPILCLPPQDTPEE